jgi:repressor of nif and glnA expression
MNDIDLRSGTHWMILTLLFRAEGRLTYAELRRYQFRDGGIKWSIKHLEKNKLVRRDFKTIELTNKGAEILKKQLRSEYLPMPINIRTECPHYQACFSFIARCNLDGFCCYNCMAPLAKEEK